MSFTNPKTWSSGDVLTAADMNSYVRDNIRWLSGNATGGKPLCMVTRTTTQALSSATWTAIQYTSELADSGTMHDNVTNNTRITVPTGGTGTYLLGGQAEFAPASDDFQRRLQLWKNGTDEVNRVSVRVANDAGTTVETMIAITGLSANCVATDYFELRGYQDSGSSLNISASTSRLWAVWVSE